MILDPINLTIFTVTICNFKLGTGAHTCHPRIRKLRHEDHEIESSLGYTLRSSGSA